MKNVGRLAPEERPVIGKLANLVKTNLSRRFQETKESLLSGKVSGGGSIDVTLPGRAPILGHLHPITLVIREVCEIFSRMGFRVVKGARAGSCPGGRGRVAHPPANHASRADPRPTPKQNRELR